MFETMMNFAKRSGLSYAAIRQLAIDGKLPHIKVGNRYMIHVEKGLIALSELAGQKGCD